MKNRKEVLEFLQDNIKAIKNNIHERAKANFLSGSELNDIESLNPYDLFNNISNHIYQSNDLSNLQLLESIKKFLYSDGNYYLLIGKNKHELAILFTDNLIEITNIPFKFAEFKVEEIKELNSLDIFDYSLKGTNICVGNMPFINNNSYICVYKKS